MISSESDGVGGGEEGRGGGKVASRQSKNVRVEGMAGSVGFVDPHVTPPLVTHAGDLLALGWRPILRFKGD